MNNKSERDSLLKEHDTIEHQLEKLKQAAADSDAFNTETIQEAQAVYTEAANKAQAKFDAAITKAQKALKDATAKANRLNHEDRDDIASRNGPLKRRLQFLSVEIRREFPADKGVSGGTGGPRTVSECDRYHHDRPMYTSDHRIPTSWTRSGSWERRRIGGRIQLRRPIDE